MSKLTLRIISLTLFMFVIGIFFIAALLTRSSLTQESQTIFDSGINFAELTAPGLYQSYLTGTTDGLASFQNVLKERLARNPNISNIMMVGITGKIIFDSDDLEKGAAVGRTASGNERYITDTETLAMLKEEQSSHRTYTVNNSELTEITVPIAESSGGHVLVMRYLLTYASLEAHRNAIVGNVLALSSPLIIIAALLSLSLAFSITRPLKSMAQIAQSIGRGDFGSAAPVNAPGELGALATSLNSMSDQLKTSRAKDASYREELSLKVEQLEAAKASLEKSLDELSRFQKVTVDRELRMNELKKLNRQLSQPHAETESAPPQDSTNNT
jgi:methyl-accepting chemotaxis protein